MSSRLLFEKKEHIAYLTIHNPEKRNALTPKLLTDLHTNLADLSKNDQTRCVIIRGSGDKIFSSGYDINAIPVKQSEQPGKLEQSADKTNKTPNILLKALHTIKHFPYPTIAMMNGHAFGAGFNLCACCDIRIAAEDIRIGMPPARLGIAYHPEGIQQFIEAFGLTKTKEIFYTANIFQGKDILLKGLVDYLVPKPDLENFTLDYAKKITRNAPLSLKGIKKIITMFESEMALPQNGLDNADQLMQTCFESDDLKEGHAAFLEKRVPKFTGK